MRFLRLATAALAAVAADARLYRIGIPAAIQPGDVFNATVEQLAGIPLQFAMVFGIQRYDEAASQFPRPGSLGPVVFHHVDLQATVGDGQVSGNTTMPGFKVPEDYELGPAAIQAAVLQFAGPLNSPIIETWWWNVNISDATSEELSWSTYADDNSRVCQIPFE
ncbi:hypothetical protein GGR53DRAFT_463871 [Hypoxylon sp. FL1150]|nr:hypothetical protein GGR53DRAFT_463871 [Hypoxylon sp. FL1150]